jgi:hypothetical protein
MTKAGALQPERFRLGKALFYASLIWIVGFVWGSFVFMTPALKSVSPIPYVSRNPAISFPILAVWLVLTYILARSFFRSSEVPAADGLRLGLTFAVVNFILDLLLLVMLLKAGFDYFASLSVWTAYAMLIIVPWLTGLSLQKTRA